MVKDNVNSKNNDGDPARNPNYSTRLKAHLPDGIPKATKAFTDRTHRDKCFCAHPITPFNTNDSPKMDILLSLFYTG